MFTHCVLYAVIITGYCKRNEPIRVRNKLFSQPGLKQIWLFTSGLGPFMNLIEKARQIPIQLESELKLDFHVAEGKWIWT